MPRLQLSGGLIFLGHARY